MNREETRAAAEVMLHFADGGEVEVRIRSTHQVDWNTIGTPVWGWEMCEYRKAQPKVSRYRRYVVELPQFSPAVRKVWTIDEHECKGRCVTPDELVKGILGYKFVEWLDTEWQEAT